MDAVGSQTVVVTILATNRGPAHNDILNRGESSAHISRPSGIVALATAKLMECQNSIRSRPDVIKYRIRGRRPANLVTGVTRRSRGEIACPHQNIMVRPPLMGVKVCSVTIRAMVRPWRHIGVSRRANQGCTANPALMTERAVPGMDPGDNLTLLGIRASAADAMAALAGANPGKSAISFDMQPMIGGTVGVTVKTTYIDTSHNNVSYRGISTSDIGRPC